MGNAHVMVVAGVGVGVWLVLSLVAAHMWARAFRRMPRIR